MTSDICADDVVVRIATPQIISSEAVGGAGGVGGGVGVPGGGARVAAAVELGRRLLLAARAGDTPQVLDLMAKGAPFTTDWLGTSPLHLAASNAHVDTCAVLLRAGVSRDARTKVDRTPLHLAACGGHASVARLLLEAGAAVDCRDMLRMTPLHWAAQRGHCAVAAELLRAGAEPRAASKFHKTPISLAAELGRHDLVKLMEDTIKDREAKKSVDALVNEEMAETTSDSKVQIFETVQRIKDIIPTTKSKQLPNERVIKIEHKTQPTRTIKIDHKTESGESESSRVAAQLLKKHGITLLPTDDGSTVLNALQSGRTVVLSDAGKLMLKESVTESLPSANKSPTNKGSGVVLTATPVTTSPRARVKVFTLNNKMLALNKDGSGRLPVKKIINPQDMQHLKFVQLPPEAKILSPSKLLPMKAKNRLVPRRTIVNTGTRPVMSTSNAGTRPAVKIIMNKSNFNKLMANAVRADQPDTEVSVADDAVDMSDEPTSEPALRAQLLAAQQQVAALRRELRAAQAKLAQYEPQM